MTTVFENATISHVSGRPHSHQAALKILSTEGFETAIEEITQWDGYAPTPLYSLKALAESLSLGEVLYKDEGARFGLGSFKATRWCICRFVRITKTNFSHFES